MIRSRILRSRQRSPLAALVFIGCVATLGVGDAVVADMHAAPVTFPEREAVRRFAEEMAERHDFDAERVLTLLGSVTTQQSVLDAMSRPAERVLTWADYRPIFLKEARIRAGRAFLDEHRALFERVEAEYGVPREIIAAIIGVETYYGRITGNYQVLAALATLAFDYPPRADFFRGELEAFLQLAREETLDAQAMLGSYAGAMGMPQFIASSYRAYAVDFDADGSRDLFDSLPDILGSVANYFRVHGWRSDEPVFHRWPEADGDRGRIDAFLQTTLEPVTPAADVRAAGFDVSGEDPVRVISLAGANGDETWVGYPNYYVITRYNRSTLYAMAVYQLADALQREGS